MPRCKLLAFILCVLAASFGLAGQSAFAAMSDDEHACMHEDTGAGGCDAGLPAATCSAHYAADV